MEQSEQTDKLFASIKGKIDTDNFQEYNDILNFINNPLINNLTWAEIQRLETCLKDLKNDIDKSKLSDCIRYCKWLKKKLDLHQLAINHEKLRVNNPKKHHPIRPRRGEIYLTELGQNIGKEINGEHLVLIAQNNKANIFGNTVVVIPISSSPKLYATHEIIQAPDIEKGRMNLLPSKAKTEQIQFIDKARLIHWVATLKASAIERITNRLKNTLDIQ
ncbi:hypothetical protein SCACP_39740 [Sporomusa carbonis]